MILTLQKLIQKAKQASDPRDAHALALDLVESMLRHYAVVAIAAYRHGGARDGKVNRILSEQLPRPSMGSWKNFLQMLSAADKGLFPESFWDKFLQPLTKKITHPDVSSTYAGLRRLADQDVFAAPEVPSKAASVPCTPLEFFDAAVAYRNRFAGHGTHELSETALQNAPLFLKGAAALCTHLNALWLACPVYVAKQAKLYGRTFFRLTPLVEAEGIGELHAAAQGMEEDRLYICFGDKKHPEVESLYPAALWEEDDILFANGTRGLIDIHYIGYASQRSFETSIYEEDFRAFIGPFTLFPEPEASKPVKAPETILPEPAIQPSAKAVPSIAVLPFVNMSADPEQEYFCDGITEEIINALSHVEALKVIARTSAFAFKGKQEDIREIGKKLDVENLLEGSIRKAGNRLRITAQLIKVADGSHLWSEKFDREMEDVFTIQDEISLAIVRELKVRLLKAEEQALVKRHTVDTEAYELYLKGRYFWEKRTEEGMKKGIKYFQQAIEKDPNYALAYAGIADCYGSLGLWGYRQPAEAYMISKEAAEKALELDSMLAEAYTTRGWYKTWYEWDFPGAKKEFKHALELNPNYATAHLFYGIYLGAMGLIEKTIDEVKQAVYLDPLSLHMNSMLGNCFSRAHRYDEAIMQLKKTLEMDPDNKDALLRLGWAYTEKAMYNKAITTLQKVANLSEKNPYVAPIASLGYVYALAGRMNEALKMLERMNQLSKEMYIQPLLYAALYCGLGENDLTFEYLEKAYDEKDSLIPFMKLWIYFDNIRSDPRYHALLKKIGLPE